jgi:hypothetical protein
MSEVTTTKTNAVAVNDGQRNAFEEFGASGLVGRFLRFKEGDFLTGDNENPEVVERGKRFVAEVQNMEKGWVKWKDKKPVDERMHLVSERVPMPTREELGDEDEDMWDADERGEPRDPWQETYQLALRDLEDPEDDDKAFVFKTTSKGGRRAMKILARIYGKEGLRMRPGQLPVVELDYTSYIHPTYGRMKSPSFKVVDWMTPPEGANGGGEDSPPFN